MIIDTHCHYNMEPLAADWLGYWQKAQDHGVTHSVIVGTGLDTTRLAIEQANQEPNLFMAPGIHPYRYEEPVTNLHVDEKTLLAQVESDLSELAQMIPNAPKAVAIGETGLDYFRMPESVAEQSIVKHAQQQAFIGQITLAEKHHLPLIIHVRDRQVSEQPVDGNAYWDTLKILKQHHSGTEPFILHCVSGPLTYIQEALSLGAYIGIAGNVTYKNADQIRSLVKTAPTNRLLLETDAPFLPPQEFRGKTCEPWMIRLTAEFVKDELGISPEECYENTLNIFIRLRNRV
jgi:TatD DNase family protein